MALRRDHFATPPDSRSGCRSAPAGTAIAASALERRETRGCHLRADFPATDPALDSHHWALEVRRRRRQRWD